MNTPDDDLLRRLKQLDIIKRGNFQLKNLDHSDIYIDIKKAYGYSSVFNDLCYRMWREVDDRVNCVVAQGYGGSPLATVLATQYDLRLSLIRDEVKSHGIIKEIEGHIPNQNDRVAIIDDVLTTGKSLTRMVEIVKQNKAEVIGCYVVVKRNNINLNVPVNHLFTVEDLLN